MSCRNSPLFNSTNDYDFGDIFPVLQSMPSAAWEEGDLTDPVSCPRSAASDPQTAVVLPAGAGAAGAGAGAALGAGTPVTPRGPPVPPRSPTFRHNPFNEDSDTNTSADVTPVHAASRHDTTTGDETESTSTELEVIRLARRRKPGKKRRGREAMESVSSSRNGSPPGGDEGEEDPQEPGTPGSALGEGWGVASTPGAGPGAGAAARRRRRSEGEEEEGAAEGDEEAAGLLRLPEMTDTSMESVGQPLREVMDRLDGALDGQGWGEGEGGAAAAAAGSTPEAKASSPPPQQQPFRGDSGGEPPDPSPRDRPVAADPNFLRAPPAPADFYRFAPHSPEPAAPGGGHHDPAGHGQPTALHGGHEDEGEAEGQDPSLAIATEEEEEQEQEEEGKEGEREVRAVPMENGTGLPENGEEGEPDEEEEDGEENRASPVDGTHPAEFRVDNNHLLLLMIHVFRENEEQLFKMLRMSTGHMEGDLQPLYLLLTDCYIYLLRKGAAEKPYTVEEAVSYNELDYISVGLDQQTITLVCTNRRRQFLLDTADSSLTVWFLAVLRSAMVKGCREPPYPSVLTDATMEKLALTKFVSQESQCEVSDVCIRLYSLAHWEDPMDVSVAPQAGPRRPSDSGSTKEGPLLYRAGTTYLGKEQWKSCYLVLSNGILYQYPERTDVIPLLSITMGGEHCGGCRRANSVERPHSFQVILTDRPALELSAENEQDMAEWMQLLCQSVSKGVIPQGVAPTPCIPCCLVLTDRKLLTCHQDCQTSFFRSLGGADLCDITGVCLERDREYCIIEFAGDRAHFLPPWVLYFSGSEERDRLLGALETAWKSIFKVSLPQRVVSDPCVQKRCGEALALIRSAWQRSDSLHRGRAQREPWC